MAQLIFRVKSIHHDIYHIYNKLIASANFESSFAILSSTPIKSLSLKPKYRHFRVVMAYCMAWFYNDEEELNQVDIILWCVSGQAGQNWFYISRSKI